MRKLFAIIFISISMSSCEITFLLTKVIDPDIPISHSFSSITEAWTYVSYEIWSKPDYEVWKKVEYWQYPSQTYNLKSGDCEDSAILLMHLLNRLGYNPSLAIIDYDAQTSTSHAVVYLNGKFYEPAVVGYFIENPQVMNMFSYEKTFKLIPIERY